MSAPRALRPVEWALAAGGSLVALIVLRSALEPAVSLATPYWWDAAAVYVPGSRWVAEHDFLAVPGVFPSLLGRGHTTLYYVITALAFRAAGSSDPVIGHAVVLAFSVLGVTYTYALGAWLFGRPAGVVGAVLLVVSPLWLTISSQALPEIPLAALSIASVYEFARGRHGAAAAWGVLVVLTKETGLACPLAIVGALSLWAFREHGSSGPHALRRLIRPAALAALPIAVLAAFFVWQRIAEGWWVLPFHAELFSEDRSYLTQGAFTLESMVAADGRGVALGAAIVLALHRWRSREAPPPADAGRGAGPLVPPRWVVLAALALLFLAYQVFFTKMWFLERYALAAHPAVTILLAGALVPGDLRAAPRWITMAGLGAATVTCALAIAGRAAGEGYDSGETTFRYVHAIEAHLAVYRALEARDEPARVLTAWPMTEELRDPGLGWVGRAYEVRGESGYFDAQRAGEALPEVDVIVTAEGLGGHERLRDEAQRLGMRLAQRAQVGGAVVERWER